VTRLLIGTSEGLFELDGDQPSPDSEFGKREATALAVGAGETWALADRRSLMRRDESGTWEQIAASEDLEITGVVRTSNDVFVGTEEAHVLRLRDGDLVRLDAFDRVEGREKWYTPWGGPPAVRSLAVDLAGRIHANVHVGGIPRSTDGGETWEPTIDIDADVHQVIAHPREPDVVLAAGAVGLALSEDGGANWRIERDGLRSTYSRAVAVAGDAILVTASDGHRGGHAAVYRTSLGPSLRLERCTEGLPEWFDGNIDTGWLAASGSTVAFATSDGRVFVSDDAGAKWLQPAAGLPRIRWLCFA
jgi:BNR/Asp-box repeat protein